MQIWQIRHATRKSPQIATAISMLDARQAYLDGVL